MIQGSVCPRFVNTLFTLISIVQTTLISVGNPEIERQFPILVRIESSRLTHFQKPVLSGFFLSFATSILKALLPNIRTSTELQVTNFSLTRSCGFLAVNIFTNNSLRNFAGHVEFFIKVLLQVKQVQ